MKTDAQRHFLNENPERRFLPLTGSTKVPSLPRFWQDTEPISQGTDLPNSPNLAKMEERTGEDCRSIWPRGFVTQKNTMLSDGTRKRFKKVRNVKPHHRGKTVLMRLQNPQDFSVAIWQI